LAGKADPHGAIRVISAAQPQVLVDGDPGRVVQYVVARVSVLAAPDPYLSRLGVHVAHTHSEHLAQPHPGRKKNPHDRPIAARRQISRRLECLEEPIDLLVRQDRRS
jgi:hypothetical protein